MPTLETDDATIRYETYGGGPPLLFLHGGWLDRKQWAPQVERFAGEFFVITPDLRDHGGSVSRGRYDVGRLAGDLRALLSALDVGRPVVCGLSMGGLVAQAYAAEHALAGLVLADTVTSMPPVPLSGLGKRLLFPKPALHAAIRALGPGAYYRQLLAGVEAAEGRWLALEEAARTYALSRVDGFDAEPFRRVFDALYEFSPPDLAGMDAPALVLHGDHEATAVVRQNRQLARRLPDARRVVIPEAGHLSNRDNPAAFNEALRTFLHERTALLDGTGS